MKKITLLLALIAFVVLANAQVILIQENFQNWTAQATSSAYSITKTLADGITSGTFSSDKLVAAPAQSIGAAGTAAGNGSPTAGRVVIGSTAGYLELPTLPTIGQVQIKANIGTDLRTMKLQVKNGTIFEDIPNTTTTVNSAVTKLYTFNFTYSVPTVIRIVTSNSSLNIWDLIVSSYVSNLPKLPDAPAIGSASSIGSESFIANWSTVTNAIGYIVKVYQGTNLISTNSISNQGTTSFSIGGLTPNTSYTYTVIAKGDGVNNSNSDESVPSAIVTTLNSPASISTDFSDVIWGMPQPLASPFVAGSFPSSSMNGFDFVSAGLSEGNTKDLKGIIHTNRISIDKSSYSGKVVLPAVSSIQQIEIHGSAGTAGNGFSLKEFNSGTSTWDLIGTYIYEQPTKNAGMDSIYIIPISRSTPTKLRIENTSSGGYYLYQVITRTTNPSELAAPLLDAVTVKNSTGFTAKWISSLNATGYIVRVYQGTTLVSTTPVDGQGTTSLAITDLLNQTDYTYNVQAVGDAGITYLDSHLSFPSAIVTTDIGTGLDKEVTSAKLNVAGKTVSVSETGNIQIFSLQGSQVFQAKAVQRVNTNLECGLYIVRFTTNSGKQFIQKISIK